MRAFTRELRLGGHVQGRPPPGEVEVSPAAGPAQIESLAQPSLHVVITAKSPSSRSGHHSSIHVDVGSAVAVGRKQERLPRSLPRSLPRTLPRSLPEGLRRRRASARQLCAGPIEGGCSCSEEAACVHGDYLISKRGRGGGRGRRGPPARLPGSAATNAKRSRP